jgi:methyltransferase (TIGR00027 family)
MSDQVIENVSDTSLWVAYYRAKETERPDALFRDPLAKILIGQRGYEIAEDMKKIGHYVEWSVVSRTVMIDSFINTLIDSGIDCVLNLGAGLDTRPYRMNLPAGLNWIEVDYPTIINLKNDKLKNENPACQLSRMALDLADVEKRKQFLELVSTQYRNILVITEGVVPYLTPDQVNALSVDLQAVPTIQYWIIEFFEPRVYRYLKSAVRTKKMKNAPFLFYPPDWLGFFKTRGWAPHEIQYSGEIAEKSGRRPPMPWFAVFFMLLASKETIAKAKRMAGYMVLKKN